jgi:multiple sugar transport system permease protein
MLKAVFNGALYLLMLMLALSMLLPFLWMISTSLMDELEVFQFPPRLLPEEARWQNYPEALTALPFGRFFLNSFIVSSVTVAGHLLFCSMAAYAFARLRFPGRDKLFVVFLSAMMVPVIIILIPRFLLIHSLGWVDTYQGIIATEIVSVWGIFLLRQYFLTIPREIEDAARIDGASEFTIFRRIILPLSKPALATLAVISFVDSWKNFLWPLIVTQSLEMRPLEVGIASFHTLYMSNWPYQMAAAVVAVLPLVVIFFLTQKYFIRGITMTGLKG